MRNSRNISHNYVERNINQYCSVCAKYTIKLPSILNDNACKIPQKIVITFSMMSTRTSAKKKFLFVAIFVSGL